MAQHLSRPLLAAFVLLLAGPIGAAQNPGLPNIPMPSSVGPAPKSAEPAPAAKELSKEEIDALIEKAFGPNCKEAQQSLRLWMPARRLVLAAGEVTFEKNGTVRMSPFSAAVLGNGGDPIRMVRGESAVITLNGPITQFSGLASAKIVAIEVDLGSGFIRSFPTEASAEAAELPPAPIPIVIPPAAIEVPNFKFKIDRNASLTDLLPVKPKTHAKLPLWTNEDLAKVPELAFGEPISRKLSKDQAMMATAHAMAKINHLNTKRTDGFMLAMLEQRTDLRGLPFLMGDACRTSQEQAAMFRFVGDRINKAVSTSKGPGMSPDLFAAQLDDTRYLKRFTDAKGESVHITAKNRGQLQQATVAALTQILMPEAAESRAALAKHLSTIPHLDATKALAKLAIFSPEDEVRAAAIAGLKLRREKDYTGILMQGFRYPLPAVSKRAAEALVKLECKDLLANLIEVLESPDPRLPARSASDGFVVRELAKVNHHRNCLLCHAPGNTDNTPEGVLKVAVPLPGEPLTKPAEGGGYQSTPPPSPDIVVRLDMTYLRQDFSMMMPVPDAHPWPEMQRFDFLVRTREVTAAEAKAYVENAEPGRLSPYHRAALFALRELTGHDTEPTAAAWRKLLKLAAK